MVEAVVVLLTITLLSIVCLGKHVEGKRMPKSMQKVFSKFSYRNFDLILKRDDLYTLLPEVNGNKARKFYSLYQELSQCVTKKKKILSYGGLQSNAMESLSHIATATDSDFEYIVRNAPPSWLEKTPVGNYKTAINNGMTLHPQKYDYNGNDSNKRYSYDELMSLAKKCDSLKDPMLYFIPQGGAFVEAQQGVDMLMDEIWEYIISHKHDNNKKKWKICFASGTGTTAFFAHHRLQHLLLHGDNANKDDNKDTNNDDDVAGLDIEVVAIPCYHDRQDLLNQMGLLASTYKRVHPSVVDKCNEAEYADSMPTVLEPTVLRPFAEPCRELLSIYQELTLGSNGTGTDTAFFDMIYAPRAFEVLYEYLSSADIDIGDDGDTNVIYYTCGGRQGNESQFKRYERVGLA
jgi:1-aminocyclopropane-1-carboxylate deaminase